MAFFIVILVVLVFLQPTTPLAIVYIVSVLAGVGVAAAHVIPAAIMPDAIEWDELKTGQRHEGMFYSLMVLSRKMGASIIIPIAVGLLGVFGYDGEAAVQPHTAVIALRTMVATIPALLLTAGIIFAWFYPLSREQHHEVTRQLAERRGEATAK
jgi:GPH family glycoside/pentoside/hexuronide:cation symporter